jgi:hypothetical protein
MRDIVPLSKITERQLKALTWVDPKRALLNLRALEEKLPDELDERVRRLRTNDLKEWREARCAAIFAYGLGQQVLEKPTLVAKVEERDFDFVMRWADETADYFYPVQLKELPPEDLNSNIGLEELLTKLVKYSGEEDLSVVVVINRRMKLDYRPWDFGPKPKIRELWYLGCTSADQSRWLLYGSVIADNPRHYEFTYPLEQDIA